MGAALSRLSRRFSGTSSLRILLLGLDAAGKTTILYQLRFRKLKETVPTLGFNVEVITYKNLELHVWDVGGQDRLRVLWRPHYRGTSGIIFVVDSSDKSRVALAKRELHALMQEEELAKASICILANKQDVPEAMSIEEVEEGLEVEKLSAMFQWKVVPTVARTGQGLPEAMDWLAAHMVPI